MSRRALQFLIIHCTATTTTQDLTAESVRAMHCNPVSIGGRGWRVPGYTDLIRLNGEIDNIVPNNDDSWVDPREVTNGAVGLNLVSRHVAYAGGVRNAGGGRLVAQNTLNTEQEATLVAYIAEVIAENPDVQVAGHNQFANKACPSFSVVKFMRKHGFAEKNICKTDKFKHAANLS